jgi:hypothetical protein
LLLLLLLLCLLFVYLQPLKFNASFPRAQKEKRRKEQGPGLASFYPIPLIPRLITTANGANPFRSLHICLPVSDLAQTPELIGPCFSGRWLASEEGRSFGCCARERGLFVLFFSVCSRWTTSGQSAP